MNKIIMNYFYLYLWYTLPAEPFFRLLDFGLREKDCINSISFSEAAILLVSTKDNLCYPFRWIMVTQALGTRLASIE